MNSDLIYKSLKKGMSYANYRESIKLLLTIGKSTGVIQSDMQLQYSQLNDKRMDRLDKQIKLSEATKKKVNLLKEKHTFLTIAEGWCGDAAQILPVINKIVEFSPYLDMKIVLRDENTALMDQFLTNGNRSIPKIIILDKKNDLVNTWGPRPSTASKMVMEYKKKVGLIDSTIKKDLQLWYNKDKGQSTQEDLITILKAS